MIDLDKDAFLSHKDAELSRFKDEYKEKLDALVKQDLHYGLAYAISIIVEYQAMARRADLERYVS